MRIHEPRVGLDIPALGTARAGLSCCRGTRGSRAFRCWDGKGRVGFSKVLSLCGVFSPLWGVFPGFRFPLPSKAVFRVWSNLVKISVPPSSPALTPAPLLDQIRDDTKSLQEAGLAAASDAH